jgi:hypothetical protein
MPGERCRHGPILAAKTPTRPNRALWLHEIKHEGFLGVVARKNCDLVRLYSHLGNDMTRHAVAAGNA